MRDERSPLFSPAVIVTFLIVFVLTGGLIFYVTRSGEKAGPAPVVEPAAPASAQMAKPEEPAKPAPSVPVAKPSDEVIDAISDPTSRAEAGRRYKVRIAEMSRGGDAGVARIGGLVTFVRGLREGDVAIVEIYELKRTTADAKIIEKLESGPVVESPREPRREREYVREEKPEQAPEGKKESSGGVVLPVGSTHKAKIVGTGRDGDGVAYVQDKVVFVTGAKEGEVVEFEITSEKERFATGKVIATLDALPESDSSAAEAKPAQDSEAAKAQPISAGEEYEVTITEDDRKNPGVNGVARVKKVVVFVPGMKIGDRARIRITEVRERTATSEVIERL